MSEIRTIPEKILASGIKDTSIDAVGKFSKKVIHHFAGVPTAADDTGLGYVVGSIWVDTLNGNMYTAVSVTAEGANWKNMDGDNVNDPFTIQGSNYGYVAGHYVSPPGPKGNYPGDIQRYPMASPTTTTDLGELTYACRDTQQGSIRDSSYGYVTGGRAPNLSLDYIQRFAFAAPNATVDLGELHITLAEHGGATDGTTGFVFQGMKYAGSVTYDDIHKFPLAAPPVSTSDTGQEMVAAGANSMRVGSASDTANGFGYRLGGFTEGQPWGPGPVQSFDTIEKFSFNSPYPVSDVGEMSGPWINAEGTTSTTHLYVSGGSPYPNNYNPDTNIVEKFAFAGPATADDVGDLTSGRAATMGASGDTHIYHAGGVDWGPSDCVNTIDRNSTSADANSTDVGELIEISGSGTGTES